MLNAIVLALAAVATEPEPATAAYRVNPAQSEAGFDLKATMHTVHGRTTRITGEVRVHEEPGGALTLSGRIEINAASLDTGNASRDKTLRTKTLAVAEHPVITFDPERFVPEASPASGDARDGTLTGALTIRGVTRPATIRTRLTPHGERIVADGTFEVAWAEFGIPDPSFAFVRIAKVAHARFKAEFARVTP